jgi:hypothetical protein
MNDPYIYFLIEPNIVFVYRINSLDYVTISDLRDGRDWISFEIHDETEFETFNHRDRQRDREKGFIINENSLNSMVERINQFIQQKRQLQGSPYQTDEVHIVTSESAAGTLRVGIMANKTVIGFPDSFSIGPLWKLDEKKGQMGRQEWLYENINDEQEEHTYENKFQNTLREMNDIPNNLPIYIWYSNNADEQTGLRFYLHLLREKSNDIYLMNSGEANLYKETQSFFHTGQSDPEVLHKYYESNKGKVLLTNKIRNQFHQEWINLSQTKELLRIWDDEEIKGVAEDYYDQLIIKTIMTMGSEDYIRTGVLLGEILTQMDEPINIFFLEYRIRHLVYTGVLALKGIPKSMRHYRVKLK